MTQGVFRAGLQGKPLRRAVPAGDGPWPVSGEKEALGSPPNAR
jgi:hypothetical protein